MNYNVDYFIEKFSAIPENKWIVGSLGINLDIHCALGHCGATSTCILTEEAKALTRIISTEVIKIIFPTTHGTWYWGDAQRVFQINDGIRDKNLEETPKKRILNALCIAKRLQEEKEENKVLEESVTFIQELVNTPVEEFELV